MTLTDKISNANCFVISIQNNYIYIDGVYEDFDGNILRYININDYYVILLAKTTLFIKKDNIYKNEECIVEFKNGGRRILSPSVYNKLLILIRQDKLDYIANNI